MPVNGYHMLPARTLTLIIILFCACSQPADKSTGPEPGEPAIAPDVILRDYASLYYYKTGEMMLTVKYTALDTASHEISREAFLEAFASGNYLPLKLVTADSSLKYKLYPLPDSTPAGVRSALQYYGKTYYGYYKREGKPFPFISLEDINGQAYTKESTSGKILVVKCWFIHCVACVKEMPRLNQLVQQYRNRDDVLFLSLAFDDREQLRSFMKKTIFDYAVIPVPERYISDSLQVNLYPTHLIVDKKGVIRNITSEAGELAAALEEITGPGKN
ncbi:thiol-disulfide isomerase/thioredoxin [Chitinophaga sp. W3I9]|uniref:TlpA family protein disulfide reductase n=1 Tax=Chitinophaga sp. W3I9 TaxID=3373924 RepID=UPI003D1F3013